MDEDEDWFRHPWEDDARPASSGRRPGGDVGGSRRRAFSPTGAPPCIRHDLALRDAGLAGSCAIAAPAGRLRREPHPGRRKRAGKGSPTTIGSRAQALAYARRWRRLAELATVQPLRPLHAPCAGVGHAVMTPVVCTSAPAVSRPRRRGA